MDDFGMLAKDFGFRPQGKSAPMKSSGGDRRSRLASSSTTTFGSDGNDIFNDVYGGPPKFTNNNSKSSPSISDFDYDYDSIFKDSSTNNNEAKSKPKSNSSLNSPVYDKPLYDDDIFDGLAGMKNKQVSSSDSVKYDDNIFASMSQQSKQSKQSDQFDDLLGSLGRTEKEESIGHRSDKSSRGLDDLIPGFGSGSPASINRRNSDPSPTSTGKTNKKSIAPDDPFVVLESLSTPIASSKGLFTDPLDEVSKIGKSKSTKSEVSSPSGDVFGDIDSLNSFNRSPPAFIKETNNRKKGQTHSEEGSSVGSARSSISREPLDESSFGYSESQPQKMPFDDFQESRQTVHDMPSVSRNNRRSFDQTTSPSSHTESMSPKSEEHVYYTDDIWLTVSEIPLFTPVTKAPPPSRPPPPIPTRAKYFQNTNAFRNKEPVRVDRHEQAMDEEREREEGEKERMREIEMEKARQVVERANREARERAASEARLKAERAAVQRVQTEARERAAVEARERAERAAAEAREKALTEKAAKEKAEKEAHEKAAVAKAQAEARRRAERAAVERVTAEARERAAAEARERAAAAKMNQQKNDNDIDSFFSTGSRPSSVPKARVTTNDSATDPLSQVKRRPEGGDHNVRKTSSHTNFVDDLSSIFGAASPAGEFQDVEGETEERRRARLERQQRTQERAAKALAEKNQRDQLIQKEQEEKQRISTTLDVEIKRWAAGKEGNLRAMLSTLQYVLWPECGWQPISLTDLIVGASVKKAYRKATLCIHPDKVQQKGANVQQKYVAEKVFDLLKEAWNKFNSEELF